MSKRKAMDRLQSFVQTDGGSWVQSPETQKVLGIMQENTDVPINVEMYPSPLMTSPGQPAWGSGSGVFNPDTGRAMVDPLAHPTVAAHEAAHQSFMSKMGRDATYNPEYQERINQQLSDTQNFTPEMVDKGASMRLAYEAKDKHRLIEEANAQGVAQAAMDKAGIPVDDSGWGNMYAYPEAHTFGAPISSAAPIYSEVLNKPGLATFTPGEASELGRIRDAASPAVRRQFDIGYQRIK